MDDKRVRTRSLVTGVLVAIVFGIAGGVLLENPASGIGLGVVMGLLTGSVASLAPERKK